MVAIGKSGVGKSRGDMLLLLVTIAEPSIAGYLRVWRRRYRGDHPGTSQGDKISGDMKIMPISGDTAGHQPMVEIVIGLTLHCSGGDNL